MRTGIELLIAMNELMLYAPLHASKSSNRRSPARIFERGIPL